MRCFKQVMAIPPANRMVAGNIASDLMLVISAGSLQPGKGNLREALSSTIIERSVPVKHDTKPRKTCVFFTFSGLYGANPYNPWAIRGCTG
jgi:hypothetical protein